MTKQEFYSEYHRLYKQFPHRFMIDNPSKLKSLFEYVESLPISWLKSFVDRVIKTNNPDLDLIKAATGEIKAKKNLERTLQAIESKETINDGALEKILFEMKADSLLDAVFKKNST